MKLVDVPVIRKCISLSFVKFLYEGSKNWFFTLIVASIYINDYV